MNIPQLDSTYIANTYARFPVTIARGKGSLVWDADDKVYIDMATGIAVNSFGIADPAWIRAVTEQLCTVQHASNLYYTAPDAQLAQLLRNAGIIEAAQAMGCTNTQIVLHVLLPEAKPSLVLGGAISIVTILGYTAIAGTVGAGGLGDIAVRYGHQRFITSVMWVTVVILLIMVQIVQSLFGWLSKKIDKRLDTGAGKLTAFDLLSRLAHTK